MEHTPSGSRMGFMFNFASSFNQSLYQLDTSQVTIVHDMFLAANIFDHRND